MARIAGVDIPREKRVEVALTYIFGIGLSSSKKILAQTQISPDTRVEALTDLICVGHTHCAVEKKLGPLNLVNLGCVSNPVPPDLRANYIICHADTDSHRVERRRVSYDLDAAIEAVTRCHHPAGNFIISHYKGEFLPDWGSWKQS